MIIQFKSTGIPKYQESNEQKRKFKFAKFKEMLLVIILAIA